MASAEVVTIPPAKQFHIAASAIVAAAMVPVFADSDHPVLYPFLVSFTGGVIKEIYDTRKKNPTGFNENDLVIDAFGAGAGAELGNHFYPKLFPHGLGVGYSGTFSTSKPEGEK